MDFRVINKRSTADRTRSDSDHKFRLRQCGKDCQQRAAHVLSHWPSDHKSVRVAGTALRLVRPTLQSVTVGLVAAETTNCELERAE